MGKREAEKEGGRKRRKRGKASLRRGEQTRETEDKQENKNQRKEHKERPTGCDRTDALFNAANPTHDPQDDCCREPPNSNARVPHAVPGCYGPPTIAAPFPAKNTVPPSDEDAESCR